MRVVPMPEIGAFLSSKEHDARALLRQAQMADAAGMRGERHMAAITPFLEAGFGRRASSPSSRTNSLPASVRELG